MYQPYRPQTPVKSHYGQGSSRSQSPIYATNSYSGISANKQQQQQQQRSHHHHNHQQQQQQTPYSHHNPERVIHKINLAALRHNYSVVESKANQQRCSVITVVKGDGYGHGAIETALHLADHCGADAFAVATLEEAIALRQAFNGVHVGGNSSAGAGAGAGAGGMNTGAGIAGGVNAPPTGATAMNGVGVGVGGVNMNGTSNTTNPGISSNYNNNNNNMNGNIRNLFVAPPPNNNTSHPPPTQLSHPTLSNNATSVTNTTTNTTSSSTTTFMNGTDNKHHLSCNSSTISSLTKTTITNKAPINNNNSINNLSNPQSLRKTRPSQKRSNRIRILVLGPPVGYPQCFNLYHHFQIELMVSGPVIARALMEWVADEKERKWAEVEKAANERKEIVLGNNFFTSHVGRNGVLKKCGEMRDNPLEGVLDDDGKKKEGCGIDVSHSGSESTSSIETGSNVSDKRDVISDGSVTTSSGDREINTRKDANTTTTSVNNPTSCNDADQPPKAATSTKNNDNNNSNTNTNTNETAKNVIPNISSAPITTQYQSATLTNVSGYALAKEVREILINQQTVKAQKEQAQQQAAGELGSNTVTVRGSIDVPGAPALLASGDGVGIGVGGTAAMEVSQEESKSNGIANSTNNQQQGAAGETSTGNKGPKSTISTNSVTQAIPFRGIEDLAKVSRTRELAAAKVLAHTAGEDDDDEDDDDDHITETDEVIQTPTHQQYPLSDKSNLPPDNFISEDDKSAVMTVSSNAVANATAAAAAKSQKEVAAGSTTALAAAAAAAMPTPAVQRKRLRWHALVDSGMGRLGFKSVQDEDEDDNDREEANPVVVDDDGIPNREKKNSKWKVGPHADSVTIIKAMRDAEIYGGAPIEFYGMCTHMADANSDSNYTNQQMIRFKSILKRVRQAGMSVPSISTDNSAALLSPKLSHFTPTSLLSQPQSDTRGFVRTGGAMFGQRPAFPELKSISTLTASVRHIAILEKDESVGYDRAYIAPRKTRIATLTIGFADGYPRELGNRKGQVCIRGEAFDVVGNVCMDMIMVDLGPAEDLDGTGSKVCVGDTAILWGPENEHDGDGIIRLQDVANKLNTTQSALTCGLDKSRVRRLYMD